MELTSKQRAQLRTLANRNHALNLAASISSNAPLARNAFVAPREQNNFVDNLTNEDIFSAEASYAFTFGPVSGKVAGYYTLFRHGVEQTAFYNDQQERFTYLTMSDVERRHCGIEAAISYSPDNISWMAAPIDFVPVQFHEYDTDKENGEEVHATRSGRLKDFSIFARVESRSKSSRSTATLGEKGMDVATIFSIDRTSTR